MSHDLERFMNNIRVRMPGALDDAIKLEIFNTVDEFCKETNAWQETIPLSVNPDHLAYEIEPEENRAVIVRLLGVTMKGESAASNDPGVPVDATLPQPDLIVFKYPPSVGSEYAATVALAPVDPVNISDGLPQIPDWFLTLYSQDLMDGVLSKMFSQPAKPYFSQNGFSFHGRKFRNAMSRVRASVNVQNTYGAQAWVFPPFARCYTR